MSARQEVKPLLPPLAPGQTAPRTCQLIDGCERPHMARGGCQYHYHLRRRIDDPEYDRRFRARKAAQMRNRYRRDRTPG